MQQEIILESIYSRYSLSYLLSIRVYVRKLLRINFKINVRRLKEVSEREIDLFHDRRRYSLDMLYLTLSKSLKILKYNKIYQDFTSRVLISIRTFLFIYIALKKSFSLYTFLNSFFLSRIYRFKSILDMRILIRLISFST